MVEVQDNKSLCDRNRQVFDKDAGRNIWGEREENGGKK
jgi:hypothetical protein